MVKLGFKNIVAEMCLTKQGTDIEALSGKLKYLCILLHFELHTTLTIPTK